jgi:uncharacterized protein
MTNNNQIFQFKVGKKVYYYNNISGDIFTGDAAENLSEIIHEEPFNEEDLILWKKQKAKLVGEKVELQNLCLVLSQDCNMRCIYCYENGGSFNKTRKIMDCSTIKKIVDWWISKIPQEISLVRVEFYGGEPLLNISGFMYAIEYINEKMKQLNKKVRYFVITNGTLINGEILEVLKINKVTVTLSIDGDRESQNVNRRLLRNQDSYDIVVQNLHRLLDLNVRVLARITMTQGNVKRLFNSVVSLWEAGIDEVDCIAVLTNSEKLRIREDDLIELRKTCEMIQKKMVDNLMTKKEKFFGNYLRIIGSLYDNWDKFYPMCGYYSYKKIYCTPDEELYNCEKLIGFNSECLGTVDEIECIQLKERITSHTYSKKCAECVMRRVCGGYCYADAKQYGNYLGVLCEIQKIQFENAFKIYVTMMEMDSNFWKNFFDNGGDD